ncbi:hypothetical protein [Dubosiella newyorkensis]|uniref:hypothetical protein n=1 Tax=Dubosiella newyorkensis TaxID=1862672 RepID=UPI003F666536
MNTIQKCNEIKDVRWYSRYSCRFQSIKYEKEAVNAIDPRKRCRCLTPSNAGKLLLQEKGFVPCTSKRNHGVLSSIGMED